MNNYYYKKKRIEKNQLIFYFFPSLISSGWGGRETEKSMKLLFTKERTNKEVFLWEGFKIYG